MSSARSQLRGMCVSPDLMVMLRLRDFDSFDSTDLSQDIRADLNDLKTSLMKAGCKEVDKEFVFIACCEFKTRCTPSTIGSDQTNLASVLKRKFRFFNYRDLPRSIITQDIRYQLLHQALVCSVNFVLFATSDTTSCTYVLVIYFDNYILKCYEACLCAFRDEFLSWMYKKKGSENVFDLKLGKMPALEGVKFHCGGNRQGVKVRLQVMMHIFKLVEKNDFEPLPAVNSIQPKVREQYDCLMGNSDLFSQAVQGHDCKFSHAHAELVLFNQILNVCTYNFHLISQMVRVERHGLEKIHSVNELQRLRTDRNEYSISLMTAAEAVSDVLSICPFVSSQSNTQVPYEVTRVSYPQLALELELFKPQKCLPLWKWNEPKHVQFRTRTFSGCHMSATALQCWPFIVKHLGVVSGNIDAEILKETLASPHADYRAMVTQKRLRGVCAYCCVNKTKQLVSKETRRTYMAYAQPNMSHICSLCLVFLHPGDCFRKWHSETVLPYRVKPKSIAT